MLFRLFLLFTLVPAVELWIILHVGAAVGPLPTVAMLIGSGLLGASLARREGWAMIRQLQSDLSQGLPPADRLIEGLLVLIGAALMIAPGFLTDLVGLAIIFPPIRRRLAPRLKRWLIARATGGVAFSGQGFSFRMGGQGATTEGTVKDEPSPPDHMPHFEHPVA